MTAIGILWPGAMGSALGRAWRTAGARVVTTVAGRSERTRRLAGDLEILPSSEDVVGSADLVVSIVPPERALAQAHDIAAAVRATGSTPAVADLNAVSPTTMALVYERAHDTPLARRTPEEAAAARDLVAVLDRLRSDPGPRPGG